MSAIPRRNLILVGALASVSLLAIYFAVLTIAESFSHAVESFREIWYLMSTLVVGFGVQSGLYYFVHTSLKAVKHAGATASAAASGGISTASMVMCCAHHVTDVVPFLGASAAGAFLADYQELFVLVGVLSNAIGVAFMLSMIQRTGLAQNEFFRRYDMGKVTWGVSILAIVAFLAALYVTANIAAASTFQLEPKVSDLNSVSVKVSPKELALGAPVVFEISMDTRAVELDYDLTRIATLIDDSGSAHQPLGWEGTPPSGHHRSGTLTFPPLPAGTKHFKLIIRDINGADRSFEWHLRRWNALLE